jgi:hypothetical protein
VQRYLPVVVVAAAIVGGLLASAASAAFSGGVCGLLTAKQVATANVTPLKCTTESTVDTDGGIDYHGYWGTAAFAPSSLVFQVNTGTTAYLQLAKRVVGDIPGAKKVSGIGSVAYIGSSGNGSTAVQFIVSKYICTMYFTKTKSLKPAAALALAKVVAGKL